MVVKFYSDGIFGAKGKFDKFRDSHKKIDLSKILPTSQKILLGLLIINLIRSRNLLEIILYNYFTKYNLIFNKF